MRVCLRLDRCFLKTQRKIVIVSVFSRTSLRLSGSELRSVFRPILYRSSIPCVLRSLQSAPNIRSFFSLRFVSEGKTVIASIFSSLLSEFSFPVVFMLSSTYHQVFSQPRIIYPFVSSIRHQKRQGKMVFVSVFSFPFSEFFPVSSSVFYYILTIAKFSVLY